MMMGISEVLNMEFCDKLVRSASLTIGHNVLLTDDCGVILASADNTRLGSLHEASLSVLKSGKMKYHGHSEAQRLSGTFPGVTIPILMGTQVVGTIGITGAPEEISRYALLIQQLAQLFLSFQQQRICPGHQSEPPPGRRRSALRPRKADAHRRADPGASGAGLPFPSGSRLSPWRRLFHPDPRPVCPVRPLDGGRAGKTPSGA